MRKKYYKMIREAKTRPAPPELSRYIVSYSCADFSGIDSGLSQTNKCLPTGMAELIFHLNDIRCFSAESGKTSSLIFPRAYLVGVMEDPVFWRIPENGRMFSVRIKPEYIKLILGVNISETRNTFTDIGLLPDRSLVTLSDKLAECSHFNEMCILFDGFLKKRLSDAADPDDYLISALEDIRLSGGKKKITRVSEDNYICKRQLERRFINEIGYSPKAYSKIIRFSSVIETIQRKAVLDDWHEFIHIHGYSDQAHFIKDFRTFAGSTPGGFRA